MGLKAHAEAHSQEPLYRRKLSSVVQDDILNGIEVLQRFQWGGVVLTTDSTDGHRSDAFCFWFQSHPWNPWLKQAIHPTLFFLNPPILNG
jgi:hypothetical protein